MKIIIPEKCKDCPFFVHDTYNYYKCVIYKKLRQSHPYHNMESKPEWCKAIEVTVDEKLSND